MDLGIRKLRAVCNETISVTCCSMRSFEADIYDFWRMILL